MKKLLILLLAVILLCACKPILPDGDLRPEVAVTVNALYDITSYIAGDAVNVVSVIPDGAEIHDYSPTARQIESLRTAAVVVLSGLGVDDVFANVLRDREVCVASDGIAPRLTDTGAVDPHMWLSPTDAIAMSRNICAALIAAMPDHAAEFQTRCDELTAELATTAEVCAARAKSGVIVTTHEAFGYLCRDLGLTQLSVSGLYAEGEPSARQLAELIQYCKDNGVTRIYAESAANPAVAETLARECGAEIVPLYTMESAEGGMSYIRRLQYDIDRLTLG
ncbi:MAG: metal ABC transporter substrate-binding protein [Oscillospiraceae bacterium]|jgi:zinc transport system substrate-binding protein|nr:metal ABC transporter substrate-binding protein [Oscillospiraceae bacterium]